MNVVWPALIAAAPGLIIFMFGFGWYLSDLYTVRRRRRRYFRKLAVERAERSVAEAARADFLRRLREADARIDRGEFAPGEEVAFEDHRLIERAHDA